MRFIHWITIQQRSSSAAIVRSISDIGIEFKLRLRPKYEAICRTTDVEHAQLVALLDRLCLINRNLVGRHLSHSNGDKAH